MDSLHNPAVLWFIAGFLLLLLEFFVPGLILFFFGAGAWLVAVVLLFTDVPLNVQLLLFLGGSLVTLALFRRRLKRILAPQPSSGNQLLAEELLGKKGIAETSIGPGQPGKVQFKGTTWSAESEDLIASGDEVLIKSNQSIILIVESLKK